MWDEIYNIRSFNELFLKFYNIFMIGLGFIDKVGLWIYYVYIFKMLCINKWWICMNKGNIWWFE